MCLKTNPNREEINVMFTVSIEKPNIKLSAAPGTPLMKVLTEAGVMNADYPCGGMGICGKCKVKIRVGGGWEEVLACQTRVVSDMEAQLDENDIDTTVCVETASGERAVLNPAVKKIFFPPSGDLPLCWEELCARLGTDNSQTLADMRAVRDLANCAYLNKGFTVVLYDGEILSLETGDTRQNLYGMAFDIGTTTIAGYLFNLTNGAPLAAVSGINPQVGYGADVITRITFTEQTETGLETLQNSITSFVDRLIGEAAAQAAVSRLDIYDLVFVGNPCMQHLFLGINPRSLGRSPYRPVLCRSVTIAAASAGLNANEAARAHWLPCVAGFVGADTVGMLLACRIDRTEKVTLAVDIGTNGEMVLWDGNNLWACSTAAGPAFEGISMTCGIRAQAGAIDNVKLSGGKIDCSVIGGGSPVGICGSGFFAAIAAMIHAGIIDKSGRLLQPEEGDVWREHVRKNGGDLAFVLVPAAKTRHGRDIAVSQQDIRQMQLAKGAIMSGAKILTQKAGISETDIDEVIVAGAFGLFLNPDDIITLGLLPEGLGEKIVPVGNAAGLGAQNALLSKKVREEARGKTAEIKYVELAGNTDFTEVFIESMDF